MSLRPTSGPTFPTAKRKSSERARSRLWTVRTHQRKLRTSKTSATNWTAI